MVPQRKENAAVTPVHPQRILRHHPQRILRSQLRQYQHVHITVRSIKSPWVVSPHLRCAAVFSTIALKIYVVCLILPTLELVMFVSLVQVQRLSPLLRRRSSLRRQPLSPLLRRRSSLRHQRLLRRVLPLSFLRHQYRRSKSYVFTLINMVL